jgi:prepilin signal peptidase PulO-like enzyme (type II secretory pathway)
MDFIFILLSSFGAAWVGRRAWRGLQLVPVEELEAAEPPAESPLEFVPVVGPLLSMLWHARLGKLWAAVPADRLLPVGTLLPTVASGLAVALFAYRLGPSWPFVGIAPLVVALVVATAADLYFGIIPDELTGNALVYTLAFVLVTHGALAAGLPPPAGAPEGYAYHAAAIRLDTGLIGLGAVGLVMGLYNFVAILGGQPMGMGGAVVKCSMVVALLVGWQGAATAVLTAMVILVVPALVIILRRKRGAEDAASTPSTVPLPPLAPPICPPPSGHGADGMLPEESATLIPFIPFLTIGSIVTLLAGHSTLVAWYMSVINAIVRVIVSGGS